MLCVFIEAVEQYRQAILTTRLQGLSFGMKYLTRLYSFDTHNQFNPFMPIRFFHHVKLECHLRGVWLMVISLN